MLIYKATNVLNNKSYIGQTTTTFNNRISGHKHRALYENDNNKFYNAIRKYGWENFIWEIVEESNDWTQEQLNQKEQYYIKLYNTIDEGYNILKGGNCSLFDGDKMAELCGSKPFYAFTLKGELIGEFINKLDFERKYGIQQCHIKNMIDNKERQLPAFSSQQALPVNLVQMFPVKNALQTQFLMLRHQFFPKVQLPVQFQVFLPE